MDSDTLTSQHSSVPDGWALLTQPPRDHVKPLTYEMRRSKVAVEVLRSAGVDPYNALAVDWRKSNENEMYVLLVSSKRVLVVDLATGHLRAASDEEAERERSRISYAQSLLNGGQLANESARLTQWFHDSPDPLPARLRQEFIAHGQDPQKVAIADAFLRGIDEIVALALSHDWGPVELVYDFSVGLSEDRGVIRSWRSLSSHDAAVFPREFAVAAQYLSSIR